MNQVTSVKLLSLCTLTMLITLPFSSLDSNAMALFTKKVPIYLSPQISGVIKNQGEPLANVELERSIYLNFTGDYYTDKTRSDAQGRFSFAQKTLELKKPSDMVTVVKRQELYVQYENKPVSIWFMNIHTLNPVNKISQKLQSLDCDLAHSEQQFDFKDSKYPASTFSVMTRCRWHDK